MCATDPDRGRPPLAGVPRLAVARAPLGPKSGHALLPAASSLLALTHSCIEYLKLTDNRGRSMSVGNAGSKAALQTFNPPGKAHLFALKGYSGAGACDRRRVGRDSRAAPLVATCRAASCDAHLPALRDVPVGRSRHSPLPPQPHSTPLHPTSSLPPPLRPPGCAGPAVEFVWGTESCDKAPPPARPVEVKPQEQALPEPAPIEEPAPAPVAVPIPVWRRAAPSAPCEPLGACGAAACSDTAARSLP